VSGFRLSKSAQADIEAIGIYTRDRWDENQATRYLTALDGCFHRIAEHPLLLGRACDDIRPGYRRAEQGSHVVFYKVDEKGLLIVRILHRKMLPKRLDQSVDWSEGQEVLVILLPAAAARLQAPPPGLLLDQGEGPAALTMTRAGRTSCHASGVDTGA